MIKKGRDTFLVVYSLKESNYASSATEFRWILFLFKGPRFGWCCLVVQVLPLGCK